jgi:hypothetical protein
MKQLSVIRKTDNTMTKEKEQKNKQRSTKYTHKTNDRVTRTSLKTMGAAECRQFLLH